MKKTTAITIAAAAIWFFFWAPDAHALRLGPLTAKPYLGFDVTYNDNVFAQNTDEVDDFVFVVSPGVLLSLPVRQNAFELEYRADIYRYADTGEANDVEDQFIRGEARMRFPGGLSVGVVDNAAKRHEARSESNLAVTGVTPLNRYYTNDLDVNFDFDVSDRLSLGASYVNRYVDYVLSENGFRDRVDNGASVYAYYRFLPRTSVLVQGVFTDVDHTGEGQAADALDSREYWAMAGVRWEMTAKSAGTVKVGYEWKVFDGAGRDFDSPVYIVELEHAFTSKTSLRVSGNRQARETDDPAVSYYVTTGGSVEAVFRPLNKLEIAPSCSYATDRYSGSTSAGGDTGRRIDDVWKAGVGIKYDMNRWVALRLGYTHSERSSTLGFYDYTENAVTFGISLSL